MKGDDSLVKEIQDSLKISEVNTVRGFDHGVFVPILAMGSNVDHSIPLIQLSLKKHLDPQEHIELGERLRKLRHDMLVIGSGSSFHNMQAFFNKGEETRK